jgi:hypothetical protein
MRTPPRTRTGLAALRGPVGCVLSIAGGLLMLLEVRDWWRTW